MTERFDIVVVGGDIHGVGVARAAACAGCSDQERDYLLKVLHRLSPTLPSRRPRARTDEVPPAVG